MFSNVAHFAFLYVVYAVGFVLDVVISLFVASAARRKDRSFGSFFWLAFFMTPLLPALVVAAIPFRVDDPRHPANKRAG